MKEERTDRKGSILTMVLMGGAVGAGLALVLAPKSGKEIREDLKQFASDTREKIGSAVDRGKDLYEAGKGAITKAVEAGKNAYVEGKQDVEHAA